MSEGFLSRWSRRKEEARRRGRCAEFPPNDPAAPSPDPPRQDADETEHDAAEPALTANELADLPKVEELTGETDIKGFLRHGVPQELRNAALRKAWMLDPTIRDFAGHARDYAYDWNTQDGVPGNCAIEPGDQVAAMARSVFGEPEPSPPAPPAGGAPEDRLLPVRRRDDSAAAAPENKIAGEEGRPALPPDAPSPERDQCDRTAAQLLRGVPC